jgi:hypothetical protein
MYTGMGSILNYQSQHTSSTGAQYDAVEQFQHSLGLKYSERERQMALCQAMHALCTSTSAA